MGFGVFIHRPDSIYDDNPAERYQFPHLYLNRVLACLQDWVIYYEPTKMPDTRGYFAVAKVDQVVPDPAAAGMYLALMTPGSYCDFSNRVPFSGAGGLMERGLLNAGGGISGRAQSAVRPISAQDFDRITALGLTETTGDLPRFGLSALQPGMAEPQSPFIGEEARSRVSYLSSRIVRDRIFRRNVLRAYDRRCGVTGLRLINGGGRAEVEAAHIRPVEADGPDGITNGIALSGTAHWMFDRGLISVSDGLEILISRQANDPDAIKGIMNSTGRLLAPTEMRDRPHPQFLKWHREHCYKS